MRIYVVEGVHDEARLKMIDPNIVVYRTNGLGVSKDLIDELKMLSLKHQIVLLLDPDGPGNKIRTILQSEIPDAEHIYVEADIARSKNRKKVGIEHIDISDLQLLIRHTLKPCSNKIEITNIDLFELGLIGSKESNDKRKLLCSKLGIGYGNAKTFLKKCNLHGVTMEEIKRGLDYNDEK